MGDEKYRKIAQAGTGIVETGWRGKNGESIEVLFMSGFADNAIIMPDMVKKGVAFIPKPFTHQGLAQKVREVLEE